MKAMSQKTAAARLKRLLWWRFTPNKKGIMTTLRMKDFMSAIQLMRNIARIAEKLDHHPDLHLTGYRNLRIELSTHSLGGLSKKDFVLAEKINRLPRKLKG